MSSEYDRKTRIHTFNCDEKGCHRNYEGASDEFKQAWREARDAGWVYVPQYVDNISRAAHYCPFHAAKFETFNGGSHGQ